MTFLHSFFIIYSSWDVSTPFISYQVSLTVFDFSQRDIKPSKCFGKNRVIPNGIFFMIGHKMHIIDVVIFKSMWKLLYWKYFKTPTQYAIFPYWFPHYILNLYIF